jgi:phosphatidylglycerophosphate synthase
MTELTEGRPDTGRLTIPVALERLRSSQKSSKGAAAYSRYVNRPLGRLLAAVAATVGLSPNQITVISAICTFAGIVLVATVPPSLGLGLAVTLLLLLGYALDSADGQVARLRGGGSLDGEWLDHVVDAVKTTSVHIAVLIGWFRFADLDPVWLLVPLGYLLADNARFFGLILSDFMRRLHRGSSAMILQREGRTSVFYSLAVLPFDYGLLLLSFLLLAWLPAFVALYTLLFVANILVVPVAFARWFREMKRLGRA